MHGKGLQNWTDDDLDLSGIFDARDAHQSGLLRPSCVEDHCGESEACPAGALFDSAPSSVSPSPSPKQSFLGTTRCILPSLETSLGERPYHSQRSASSTAATTITTDPHSAGSEARRIRELEVRLQQAEQEARCLRSKHDLLSSAVLPEGVEGQERQTPPHRMQLQGAVGSSVAGSSTPGESSPSQRRASQARVVASVDIPLDVYQRACLYQRSAPTALTSSSASPPPAPQSARQPPSHHYTTGLGYPTRHYGYAGGGGDTSHLVPFVP